MRILADRNMCAVETLFSKLGQVELVDGRHLRSEQLAGVDALLVRSVTRVDDALLKDHEPRFVGSATSGIDHVDSAALAARGIAFAYAPGSNADSVVEYVLSAIAHCGDKLERLLAGAELGIIGYGHIGKRLRQRLLDLGIASIAYDPWLATENHPGLVGLTEVLACEVVSVHAALTHQQPWPSYHLLGAEQLACLQRDALLINAGRGELLDQAALLDLLRAEPARQIVLDVWEGEPEVEPELLAHCLFGTAHIAGYSYDGKLRASGMLYLALCAAIGVSAFERKVHGEPVSIEVPTELGGAGLLRWLLAQAYDIREDDALLRAAMPGGFDQLRRDYRRRRELGALVIANPEALAPEALRLCAAMGCAHP